VASIGRRVTAGQLVATIGDASLTAPLTGIIQGLAHSGAPVAAGTKIIEVDPRGDPAAAFGLGERPRRIAEGVCRAVAESRLALT
jgi:xanthine dehydrogenase accessory factor